MLKTIRQMAATRIAVVRGKEEREQVLVPLGTTLHHMPLERFAVAYDATADAEEAREIGETYRKHLPMLKAYCQLSGLAVTHIDGGTV